MTPADLAAWRDRLGLTKAAAARALQTPYRTYQDWERGVATPPGCLHRACLWITEHKEEQPWNPTSA